MESIETGIQLRPKLFGQLQLDARSVIQTTGNIYLTYQLTFFYILVVYFKDFLSLSKKNLAILSEIVF